LDFIKITRLFEDISRERESFVYKCGDFIKISIIFEDFLEKLRLFQGLRGFLNTFLRNSDFFPNVSVVFIKTIAAETF
jgi:hypothetical protein